MLIRPLKDIIMNIPVDNMPIVHTYETLVESLSPLPEKRPLVIAVDGRPCSGKTTLSLKLADTLYAQTLFLDEFFIPRRSWPQDLTPRFPFFYFRYREFIEGIKKLSAGKEFRYFSYDWQQDGLSTEETVMTPDRPVIVEGVSAFNDEVVNLYFKKIWVLSDQSSEYAAIMAREGGKNEDLWRNVYLPSVNIYCTLQPWLKADIIYAGRGAQILRKEL